MWLIPLPWVPGSQSSTGPTNNMGNIVVHKVSGNPWPARHSSGRNVCRPLLRERGVLQESPTSDLAFSKPQLSLGSALPTDGKSCPLARAQPAAALALPHERWLACSLTKAMTVRWMKLSVRLWCGPRPESPASLLTVPTGGTSAPGQR